MPSPDLAELCRIAEAAADVARKETLPRFRRVGFELKRDGSPVTEADRAAERAIRALLREATPDVGILGEEYGEEGGSPDGRHWLVDPIDGTLSFSRGVPLFGTLIALVEDGEPRVGVIDLPALDERYSGYSGGGAHRNGERLRASERDDLGDAIVAHGDVYCFDSWGDRPAWDALASRVGKLRGYTDCFGHAQVVGGAVDAMVDLCLNPWDAAAVRVLVPEAGGRCAVLERPDLPTPLGLVMGSPALVEQLLPLLADGGAARG